MYVKPTVSVNWQKSFVVLAKFKWNKKISIWGRMGKGEVDLMYLQNFWVHEDKSVECWRYTELQWKWLNRTITLFFICQKMKPYYRYSAICLRCRCRIWLPWVLTLDLSFKSYVMFNLASNTQTLERCVSIKSRTIAILNVAAYLGSVKKSLKSMLEIIDDSVVEKENH